MKGHIEDRGNSYRIIVSLGKNSKGKYEYYKETFSKPEKNFKQIANQKLREILQRYDRGILVNTGKQTMADYLRDWLKVYCWPNLAPRTAESYQYMCEYHLIPAIGQMSLSSLKPQHLQRLYSDKLSSGLSNRTVQYIHSTIHKALQSAVKMGLVGFNIADSVDRPCVKKHEMNIMSESDVHILLEYSRNTPYYALFHLLLFTGLRRSEALALRWSDIDLLLCQLSVSRTLHQMQDGKLLFGETKTAKSQRMIALTPSSALVLKEHLETENKKRTALNLSELKSSDLIFCKLDGSPFLPLTITHAFIKLAKKCGLQGIRLHSTRHTHASLMLKAGVNMKVVQERLGHSSIQVTMDIYSHVAPGLQQAAANKFDTVMVKQAVKEG